MRMKVCISSSVLKSVLTRILSIGNMSTVRLDHVSLTFKDKNKFEESFPVAAGYSFSAIEMPFSIIQWENILYLLGQCEEQPLTLKVDPDTNSIEVYSISKFRWHK